MRIPEYHVAHHRTGWYLHLSETSLTRLFLTNLLDQKVPALLAAKFVWAYRPWSWAICKLDGRDVAWMPITPMQARELDPTFADETDELFGDDLLPDGSLRKEVWK